MAESALDRLKRLAAEKKQAAAQPIIPVVEEEVSNERAKLSSPETPSSEQRIEEGEQQITDNAGTPNKTHESYGPGQDPISGQVTIQPASEPSNVPITVCEPARGSNSSNSTHPLAVEFAELEAMLLAKDPEFKLLLRQVHKHLSTDPELVTLMTEEEVQLIVTGMVVFANAEIVEPAKAKTAKAAVTAAKKKTISADDL